MYYDVVQEVICVIIIDSRNSGHKLHRNLLLNRLFFKLNGPLFETSGGQLAGTIASCRKRSAASKQDNVFV